MAVADEGLELAGSETVQEGDRLSLGDTPEEEASTDEVDPCRKRCGRDHGVVLEECRLAFITDRVGGTASLLACGFLPFSHLRCSAGKSMWS